MRLLTMYIFGMWQVSGLYTIPDCVIDLFEFTTERKSTRFYDVIELKSTNKGFQRCLKFKQILAVDFLLVSSDRCAINETLT